MQALNPKSTELQGGLILARCYHEMCTENFVAVGLYVTTSGKVSKD